MTIFSKDTEHQRGEGGEGRGGKEEKGGKEGKGGEAGDRMNQQLPDTSAA